MNQRDLTRQDWAYPVHEVIVDPSDQGILGRGAFGIVRRANWCGSQVAVKQLHAQDEQGGEVNVLKEEDIEALVREMSICSRLRHPNLVLFLGVTYDPVSRIPQSIVTEILPFSVYDLLETRNIRFEPHEVFAMACDIANALNYLHERKPPVVHRDISARNVLVDHQGRAKLSDLGQAKILGGASSHRSQNTTMPGAMAYAAPEVLTGRYSSPIDMFSFGVLVTQLVTGEFPRIDRREQQVAQAIGAIPKLGPMISRCLQLHPEKRPTAAAALDELKSLHNLDSHLGEEGGSGHGHSKRLVHDYGPLAERWLRDELREANRRLETDLSTAEARLSSELGRWRVEADARDKAESQITSLSQEVELSIQKAKEAHASMIKYRQEAETERSLRIEAEISISNLKNELSAMEVSLKEQSLSLKREVDSANAAKTMCEYAETAKKRAVENEKRAGVTCAAAVKELESVRQELSRTKTEKEELNEWLQQSINRWEKEKSNWLQERTDLKNSIKTLRTSAQVERLAAAKQAEELGSMKEELDSISKVELSQLLENRCVEAEEKVKELSDENILLRDQFEVMQNALTNAESDLYSTQKALDDAMEREQSSSEEALKVKELVDKAKAEADEAVADAETARKAGEAMSRKLGEQSVRITELQEMQAEYERQMLSLKQLLSTRATTPNMPTQETPEVPRAEEQVSTRPSLTSLPLISPRASGSLLSPSEKKSLVNKTFTSGGVTALVKLIQGHKDVELHMRVARMIRDKCSDEQTRHEANVCGAPHALVQSMQTHPSDPQLQQQCMRALGNVCFGHDANRAAAGEAGAGAAVVRVLKGAALSDADLMGYAFTCVTNLAHHSPGNRKWLAEEGVVEAMQVAMSKFPLNPKLQQQGCWVMLTLAASDEIAQNILQAGGVNSVIAAMVNISEDISVQHFGCWALANIVEGCLSCDPKCLSRFRSAGAVEVCKAAVRKFPNHTGVSQRGLLALKLLLSK